MKICILGNKTTTSKLIENIISSGQIINYIVTLNEETVNKSKISGADKNIIALANYHKIPVYLPQKYSLNNDIDLCFFKNNLFDLGLCTGWQRIIPTEILSCFKHGVFGWHGSGFELPNGRGRSPLNWSIRLGFSKIYHNCFKYSSGADTGPIYNTEILEINDNDYISDIQEKAVKHMIRSSINLIRDINDLSLSLFPQPNYPFISFPALNEESGEIHTNYLSCTQSLNIIRSCSKPFPGAYVKSNSKFYRIWKAKLSKEIFIRNNINDVIEKNNILYLILKDGVIESDCYEFKKISLQYS